LDALDYHCKGDNDATIPYPLNLEAAKLLLVRREGNLDGLLYQYDGIAPLVCGGYVKKRVKEGRMSINQAWCNLPPNAVNYYYYHYCSPMMLSPVVIVLLLWLMWVVMMRIWTGMLCLIIAIVP